MGSRLHKTLIMDKVHGMLSAVAVKYSTVVFNIFLNIIQNIKTMFETVPVLSASEGGFYTIFVCALFVGATH
jgi:hypothetical protein